MAEQSITQLLVDWGKGDRTALDRLMPLVYAELRRVAQNQLRHEQGHTLQATALVHEAYLKLIDQERVPWSSREQFFAISARLIRRILVDHARARKAQKRGGAAGAVELDTNVAAPELETVDLLSLDMALDELGALDEQQARIVELRFFAGLSIDETAAAMSISPATVNRDWSTARLWLCWRLRSIGSS